MNALLANDPALPQRDVLVDEAVMAQYLSRLMARYGNPGINNCERLRTKYHVGASLRVLYQVSGGGHAYRIAARAFPRSQQVTNKHTHTPEIYAPELNTIFDLSARPENQEPHSARWNSRRTARYRRT